MKRLLPLLGLLLVAATMPARSSSAAEITVTGEGSISLIPDTATVYASVETNAEGAVDATSQNNQIYDRVVAAVTKTGVARDDITLAYYNVNYVARPKVAPPAPDSTRYGYTVTRSFAIKVRNMNNAGTVVDALTSAGVSNIGGVSFGLADPSKARSQATNLAVADARSKAELLANAAGLHITGIRKISMGGGAVQPLYRTMAAAVPAPTAFDSGDVTVNENVTVVFAAAP